jgi:hypothetical protein
MRRPLLALGLVAIVYAGLAFLVLPQAAFFSSDEGLKLIQVQNFLRKGWSDLTIDYPGRWLDPGLRFVPINNPPPLVQGDRIFAVYPVLFPLLATSLYSLLGYGGLYVIPVVSGLATVLVTWWLARLVGARKSSSLLVLGLCTPLLFYSLLFWDHTLGTLLTTTGLLLVIGTVPQHDRRWLLAGGAILGVAVWARTELYALAVVTTIVYFLFGGRRGRDTLFLCLGILAALLPLWTFQAVAYGNPIGPHVAHFASLGEELPVTTNRLAILYYTLLEASSNPLMTFLYAMAFASATLTLWNPTLRHKPALVAATFGALLLCSIPILLEAWSGRPLGGLIATTPFLAFSFSGIPGGEDRLNRRLALAACLGYIILVCVATPVDPGLQWGPRFLLPIYPLATVLALRNGQALSATARSSSTGTLLRGCLMATLGVSLLFQACGIHVMQMIKTRDRQLIDSTARLDSTWIVSDEYGLAQYAAPIFYEKEFFYVRSQEEYQRLAETFVRSGIDRYAVVTYPVAQRRIVDPGDAWDGYAVREVGPQLFEIAKTTAGG